MVQVILLPKAPSANQMIQYFDEKDGKRVLFMFSFAAVYVLARP
jgi:hypothetical protein